MTLALATVVALPGLAIGSFLNVVASRVPLRRSVSAGRSCCMACSHEIAAYDNVPIVSWVMLRGRCRHCCAAIPARYPLVELVTTLLVVGCVLRFGVTLEAALAAFFCIVLVVVSAIEIEHRTVPDRIVLPAAAVALAAQTALHPSPEWLIAAFAAAGFLFVAARADLKGLVMGDVKLAILLGAMLGASVIFAILFGLLAALVATIVLTFPRDPKPRNVAIPFAPFLAFGGVVALFAGTVVLDGYLGISI